jgi:hypothetical protein
LYQFPDPEIQWVIARTRFWKKTSTQSSSFIYLTLQSIGKSIEANEGGEIAKAEL